MMSPTWIDDVFVTGTLTEKLAQSYPILMYNWRNAFLVEHSQYETEVLSGKFTTPELMVGFDLNPESIQRVYIGFKRCHDKKCYQIIYDDPKLEAIIKPPVKTIMSQKQKK